MQAILFETFLSWPSIIESPVLLNYTHTNSLTPLAFFLLQQSREAELFTLVASELKSITGVMCVYCLHCTLALCTLCVSMLMCIHRTRALPRCVSICDALILYLPLYYTDLAHARWFTLSTQTCRASTRF